MWSGVPQGKRSPVTEPRLVYTLIDEPSKRLLEQSARGRGVAHAEVRRFSRFGRSGSELYLLVNTAPDSTAAYAVKIGNRKAIHDEYLRGCSAEEYIPGHDGGKFAQYRTRAAICTEYVHAGGQIVELDDYHRRALGGDLRARELLIRGIDATYSLLQQRAHVPLANGQATHATRTTYDSLFARYRRKKYADRVERIFSGRHPLRLQLEILEHSPLDRLEELMDRPVRAPKVRFVHGDLHLSNIVLRDAQPNLIDFAWSEMEDHPFKDYVMAESSIRFMRSPTTIPPHVIERIDACLNADWSCSSAFEASNAAKGAGRIARTVMIQCVERVREWAAKLAHALEMSDEDCKREYFTALYLVLAGQQRFDTFPLLRVIATLDQIGRNYVFAE